MTKCAIDCLKRFSRLTKQLEVQLGPSTGELQARVGLHSGPVTGGVLRGDKARFQLFGDTVNTAARMESNGAPGMIQISQTTADLLIAAGKEQWVRPRADLVLAKGKGKMKTFWVETSRKSTKSGMGERPKSIDGSDISDDMVSIDLSQDPSQDSLLTGQTAKVMRLVEWNVEILYGLLKKVVAGRDHGRPKLSKGNGVALLMREEEMRLNSKCGSILDEVVDAIEMPRFDPRMARRLFESESLSLEPIVKTQLHEFVLRISSMYRDLPFHNFEHASHVAMSSAKLLKRIIDPADQHAEDKKEHEIARNLHRKTFGISSDPLMQFTLVFAALICDIDHPGLSNVDQVRNNTPACKLLIKPARVTHLLGMIISILFSSCRHSNHVPKQIGGGTECVGPRMDCFNGRRL